MIYLTGGVTTPRESSRAPAGRDLSLYELHTSCDQARDVCDVCHQDRTQLFREMVDSRVEQSTVTYNAAVSACKCWCQREVPPQQAGCLQSRISLHIPPEETARETPRV